MIVFFDAHALLSVPVWCSVTLDRSGNAYSTVPPRTIIYVFLRFHQCFSGGYHGVACRHLFGFCHYRWQRSPSRIMIGRERAQQACLLCVFLSKAPGRFAIFSTPIIYGAVDTTTSPRGCPPDALLSSETSSCFTLYIVVDQTYMPCRTSVFCRPNTPMSSLGNPAMYRFIPYSCNCHS